MTVTSLEALSGDSRAQRLRYRHRDYYLAIADESVEGLRGPDQQKWRQIIKDEYDNFIHAFEWCVDTEDSESALRLAMVVARILTLQGDTHAAEKFLRAALELSGGPTKARVSTMLALADNRSLPDPSEALELREQAHRFASTIGDKKLLVDALTALGGWVSSVTAKQRPQRRQMLEEALSMAREIGYDRGVAEVAWRLAEIYRADGLKEEARDLERSALEFYRKIGDIENVGWMLYQEAWSEPDPARSLQLAQEGLDLARRLDDLVLIACCFELLVSIFRDALGDLASARSWQEAWNRELSGRELEVARWHQDWNSLAQAWLDIVQGRWHDAERAIDQFFKGTGGKYWPAHERSALLSLAKIKIELEGYESASPFLHKAIEVSRRTGFFLGASLKSAAELALVAGDLDLARKLLEEALSEAASTRWEIEVLELLARLELRTGEIDNAASLLESIEALAYPVGYVGRDEPARRAIVRARIRRAQGRTREASSQISSAIKHLAHHGHPTYLAEALEEAAALREQLGEVQTGALVLGAARALRDATEYPVQQIDRFEYQDLEQRLRESLSDGAYDRLVAEGQKLPLAEAVALAATDTQE